MVAAGIGVTVPPVTAVPENPSPRAAALHPVLGHSAGAPRGAGLAPQLPCMAAVEALAQAVYACGLPGVNMLTEEPAT